MRKSHSRGLTFALAILSFVLTPDAHAQYPGYLTNSNDTGLPSYGSFISSNVDTVNLGTGGVTIRIPISSTTGRGTTYSQFLQYDSKYWNVIPNVQTGGVNGPVVHYQWVPDTFSGLWQARDTHSVGGLQWTETMFSCDMPPQGGDAGAEMVYMFGPATVRVQSNYIYTSPDGSKHQLPLRKNVPVLFPGYCPNLNNGQLPENLVAQTDNGHVQVDITNVDPLYQTGVVITLPNGTHSNSLGEIDSNGNICCAAGRPAAGGGVTDYTVTDSNGNVQHIHVDFTTIAVNTAFPTTSYDSSHDVYQSSTGISVISKITLPNGLFYTFSYDPTFGEITKITLPTGGYVRYVWESLPLADMGPNDPLSSIPNQIQIDARRISQRIVSEDGTTGSEKVWNYSYSGFQASNTTVTDPDGNSEVHGFGMCSAGNIYTQQPSVDWGVSYYDPSGKLIKSVGTGWSCQKGALYIAYPGQNLPFTYSVLTEGSLNLRQTGSSTTLGDTNQVSSVESDFNDCYNYTIYSLTYTDCRDNPTETREYDYGIGSHGSLLRKTDFKYLHNPNLDNASNAYLAAHIWDRVKLKSVYDGSGNLVAQTQYGYDEGSITAYNGATNHDDTDYPSGITLRGNVTTVGRWLNTTSTFLTTTNVYNQVGNLVQTTDPGGHTYYLYYDDNYSDGVDRKSQAFLTHVVSPTTSNGVSHVEGKQYFWYTGLTAAVCGQNAPSPATCTNSLNPTAGSPVSDYAKYSYDLMNRPATVTHGDGGVTNFTFNESSLPFSVSSSSAIDSAQNLINTAVIDGLGRVKQTQLNSDPDGADFVDTTYDAVGQKSTVSNPHRSGSSSTDGVTTYLYDALGRTTVVIPPDGTTTSNNVSTIYSGNKVTVTDQAGKQRRSVTDALGRLIEVDEPGAPTGAVASNGYAVISGTELWGGGTFGQGTVTISGVERNGQGDPPCTLYDNDSGDCIQWGNPPIYYDQGIVSITVNGHTNTTSYDQFSTPANIASNLATAINADSAAPVTAGVVWNSNPPVISLSTKVHTASTMSLSANAWSTDTSGYIWFQSFFATPSGSALTGGTNDWADTGTVTLTIGGVQSQVTYNSSSTPSSLATALASVVNGNSSALVTASASGGTINFTDKTQGTALGLSLNVVSNYPSTFVPISFSSAVSDEYLNNFATTAPGSLLTPMVTLYTYDALDNLTCVEQHGTATGQTGCSSAPSNDSSSAWRIRRFTYDSLGRLVTAKNPESGTISYTYDSDGNVITKTDARGITTTMTYDELHRVTQKTYSDGTTSAFFAYDGTGWWGIPQYNVIGRLMEQWTGTSCCGITAEIFSYDSRGRVILNGPNSSAGYFPINYTYNFAGGLTSETNPMGFTLNMTYDPAARLKTLTSSWSDAQHPATLLSVDATAGYTPAGALAKMTYGNGLVETSSYNNRLQPTQLRTYNPTTNTDILNLNYGFTDSAGANNGNVVSFISTATQVFMRSYTYDELNRLSTMSSPADASGCYGLTWTYDAWGNRLNQNTAGGSGSACASPSHGILANNRITDTGFAHDASGNTVTDGTHGYTYDAESRLVSLDGGAATYLYDAGGQRVRKISGGVTTDYVRDESGNVVAEIQGSTWTKSYVYVGTHLLAQYNGAQGASGATTVFALSDHLGSTRVMTTVAAGVSDSMDYLPFGELLSGGSSTTHEFTGKERDTESGLDDFGARYFSSALGRFVSADWSGTPEPVPYANFGDPQSLNLYAYVRNNPLNATDMDGHDWGSILSSAENYATKAYSNAASGITKAYDNAASGMTKAYNTTATAISNTVKDTVNSVGAGIGEYVAGVCSGDSDKAFDGINKVGATIAPLLGDDPVLDGEGAGAKAASTATKDAEAVGTAATQGASGITEGSAARTGSQIDRTAFRSEREAYWKAEAQSNPGKYDTKSLERMKDGKAPIGPDGHPMELHHVNRTQSGGVKPMSRTDHRLGPNYKKNHPDH
jgi:RHS repeat-associated protein